MRVHLRFLQRREPIEESLRLDGWQLERHQDGGVTAQHPLVKDEAAARIRLQGLDFVANRFTEAMSESLLSLPPVALP